LTMASTLAIGPAVKSFTERGHASIRTTPTNATGKWATKSPKGLFATKDLPAGTEIFTIERPLIAALSKERLVDTCTNCYKPGSEVAGGIEALKACTGCKQVKYCGKVRTFISYSTHY
jgi:hypothetical protein